MLRGKDSSWGCVSALRSGRTARGGGGGLLLLVCFLLTPFPAVPAAADERPDYSSFVVCTASGRYCAEMARTVQTTHPWKAWNKLTVWEKAIGQRRELWSQPYEYDGYAGGLLSSDGRIFIHVSSRYYPGTVIWVYSREGAMEIPGRNFPYHHTRPHQTDTHERWLVEDSPYELVGVDGLRINTVDGRSYLVDLLDGKVTSPDLPSR